MTMLSSVLSVASRMRLYLCFFLLSYAALQAATSAVTDYTNYNAGDTVQIRLAPSTRATLAIRYAGETEPIKANIPVTGSNYQPVWTIPADARTGRYEVDLTPTGGKTTQASTSFAVHRQLAKVLAVDLDKTFYTSGDSVNPTITIRNVSRQRLSNLQIEFEPYTYPWIAPEADEPRMWKHIVADALSLQPGEQRIFRVQNATTAEVEKTEPMANYYAVVVRDHEHPDHIYDLAFASPAFTFPPNTPFPKQYPYLYLYWYLKDVPKSQAYRSFYPPSFVSAVVQFDTSHTMFPAGICPAIAYTIKPFPDAPKVAHLVMRVLDSNGHELETHIISDHIAGNHTASLQARTPGLYLLQVLLQDADGATVAQNRIEFAVNRLPKSILVFCAHQDDETAHPGLIRAAVENHIPIHFVYFTGGDAGGCDRFYMHSCDAARALDFGEVRMGEARASLGHLGVGPEGLFFLGLPDGGLGQIWRDYPSAAHPYLSVLLASDHSPYRESAIPNLPYALAPVLAATKRFIQQFDPDLIVTGHPDERHVDHRTNNWIVVKAMQELLEKGLLPASTRLLVDQVYGARSGLHAPYRYEKQTFFVSGEVAKLAQEATWYYESQDGNHQQARITDFTQLPREEPYPHSFILDWQDHQSWNERPGQSQ